MRLFLSHPEYARTKGSPIFLFHGGETSWVQNE